MKNIQIQLEPLSCPSCIKRIEGALNKQKGIKDARVLFSSSKVKALYDEDIIKPDEVVRIIEKLGYPVVSTKAA